MENIVLSRYRLKYFQMIQESRVSVDRESRRQTETERYRDRESVHKNAPVNVLDRKNTLKENRGMEGIRVNHDLL